MASYVFKVFFRELPIDALLEEPHQSRAEINWSVVKISVVCQALLIWFSAAAKVTFLKGCGILSDYAVEAFDFRVCPNIMSHCPYYRYESSIYWPGLNYHNLLNCTMIVIRSGLEGMLMNCSISKVFTCPLLSWCKISK